MLKINLNVNESCNKFYDLFGCSNNMLVGIKDV